MTNEEVKAVRCPKCGAQPREDCRNTSLAMLPMPGVVHVARRVVAKGFYDGVQ